MAEMNQSVTYTEAIARGGSLLTELQTLLMKWEPGESTVDLFQRALREDMLGKAAARTVSDYVRAFGRRFLIPTDDPARHLHSLITRSAQRQAINELVFYYSALQDYLLRDFTLLCYWPAVREGRLTIAIEDARNFLREAEYDGRISSHWSGPVKRDMPARILKALSDFGFLGELKRSRREILSLRPSDTTVTYIAHLLRSQGITDGSLAIHEAWKLFGMEPSEVWDRLEMLASEGWFIIQRAGQVIRITWKHQSVEDAVDAISRR